MDDAICAVAVGQGEDLLGRHVGSESNPIFSQRLGADPFVPAGQTEGEVCFIRLIVQGRIFLGLQITGAFPQILDVLLPGGDGVRCRGARRFKNRLPQLCLGFFDGEIREHLGGPGGRSGRGDAPVTRIASDERTDGCPILQMTSLHGSEAFRIQPVIHIRVVRVEREQRVAFFQHVQDAADLPFRIFAKRIGRRVLEAETEHLLIAPDHVDKTRACRVRCFGHGMDKGPGGRENPARSRVGDDQALAGPQVQSDPYNRLGIFLQ